ncbi:prib protein [Moniliophthora roreri]|nr:prib protein [Moniliophthora roreri]
MNDGEAFPIYEGKHRLLQAGNRLPIIADVADEQIATAGPNPNINIDKLFVGRANLDHHAEASNPN